MPETPDTIDDALDALVDPTTAEVLESTLTRDFSAREIAAAAVTRGGGGEPAGADGQIQFNDNGAFGATADLTLSGLPGSPEIHGSAVADGIFQILGGATGVQVHVIGGEGDATHVGGEIVVASGDATDQNGGDLTLSGGGSTDGDGGNVTLKSGTSENGSGGEVAIRANPGGDAGGAGGNVIVSGGGGATGGDVIVSGGNPDGGVQLYSGDSNQFLELNNNGLILGDKIDCSSLPTANPGVAGRLWNDAGTLKVSAG